MIPDLVIKMPLFYGKNIKQADVAEDASQMNFCIVITFALSYY